MRRDSLFLLAGAFALSIIVRLPQLDRPLGGHHELCTALVLTVLHNWHQDGFLAHKGVPPVTFTGPADRYPAGWTDSPALHDGVLYYASHPPLAYDLPFLLFRLLGQGPHVLGLQVFNLFFHGVAACCLLLLVAGLVPGPSGERAGRHTAVLYLFMPAPLWFHGNAYMSDMFVQVPWLFHLVVAQRLFNSTEAPSSRSLLLFGASLFVTLYTSWLGAFAALAAVGVAVVRRRSLGREGVMRVAAVGGLACAAAMLLTAWRYLQVFDPEALVAYLRSRFAVRGPAADATGSLNLLRQVLENYRTGYLPVIGLLAALVVHRILRGPGTWPRTAFMGTFLLLAGSPVLLEHTVLMQYAHHDFTALKGGVLLCGLAGTGLAHLPRRTAMVAVLLTTLAGVAHFHRLNPSPWWGGKAIAAQRDMGWAIAAEAVPDGPVFFQGYTPEPQVVWYAGRTIFRVDAPHEARAFLARQGTRHGVLFRFDAEGGLVHEPIAVDGP